MDHPVIQMWLARGRRTTRGFEGEKKVRGRVSVDECHEKTGMTPKDRRFFGTPSYAVESKGRWPSDRKRKAVLLLD